MKDDALESKELLKHLALSSLLIFLGRSYQHLFWDAPFRSFFWDEALLKNTIETLGISWKSYATSNLLDNIIQRVTLGFGLLYLTSTVSSWLIIKNKRVQLVLFQLLGGIALLILSLLLMKEKFYHAAQFFEHSIQFGTPILLFFYIKKRISKHSIVVLLKLLIAITFTSHGLYAFGFYPVPGKFIDMLISVLSISEPLAINVLYIAGILDFIVAILIFVPIISKYALAYAVVWGLLTAIARLYANFYWDFPWQSIHQNLFQTIYRLPHGLIPLLAFKLDKSL